MIYKKLENFISDSLNTYLLPAFGIFFLFFIILISPLWLPFWFISKFWNTKSV